MNARTRELRAPVPHAPHASRRSRSRVCVRALVLLALAGCGGEPGAVARSDREVTSGSGGSVRIVSLVPSLAELTVAIGAGATLVARTDYDTHPDLTALPSIGGGLDPSLEAMVSLEVDVVLMPEGQEMPALAARLGDLGISTVGLRTETVQDLHDAIQRIGALTGREASADSLSGRIARELGKVRSAVEGRPAIPVMYVVWSDPPMTAAGDTYIDELITLAGGDNIFRDAPTRWPTVGYESIVRRNPEVIIWPRGADSEITLERVRALPGWRDLDAVRGGRVVFVDSDRFNRPGPGLPDAARLLARALHPEAFISMGP